MNPVERFEREFAARVGAKHGIALCNGTATLHTALHAIDAEGGDVIVPPLTMSSTALAVLHAGAVPVWVDIDRDTWLLQEPWGDPRFPAIPVGLYGLSNPRWGGANVIHDGAQTVAMHSGCAFTSYSFQASKHLGLGEGGMLVTNVEECARRARSFSSLGYPMTPDGASIDKVLIKQPDAVRHYVVGWNYRMAPQVAERGLAWLKAPPSLLDEAVVQRFDCAGLYMEAVRGCPWVRTQVIPQGWQHDWWAFVIATDTPDRATKLIDLVEGHGGERPYPAWRLGYEEPALARIPHRPCPNAFHLRPRLVQFQTNDVPSARTNAEALRRAVIDLDTEG